MTMVRYADRREAGVELARKVLAGRGLGADPLVLGLVRGGAPVAAAFADTCGAPWDVFVVRKIGAPQQPEYALGALAETGHYLMNQLVVSQLELSQQWVDAALRLARKECRKLAGSLRGTQRLPPIEGRDVVLTDDGVATGFTMRAAVNAVTASRAASVTIAVPVIAPDTLRAFAVEGIACLCLAAPPGFRAVGQYYREFGQVTTGDVQALLAGRSPG